MVTDSRDVSSTNAQLLYPKYIMLKSGKNKIIIALFSNPTDAETLNRKKKPPIPTRISF